MSEPLGQTPIRQQIPPPPEATVANAQRLKEYDQVASAALKQIGPIPEPHYGQVVESNCNNLTCEEVRDIIASVVKDYINRTDYNSFPFAFQFFEFFEQARANDPYIDVATAFAQFKPDSNNEVALAHGSTCVGHSNELVKVLDDNRIKAHVVVETNGPNEPPSHAAVLVPCNNGVILVEIYDENPLIILKPDPAHEHNIGTDDLYINIRLIETSGNYKSDKLMISKTTVGVEKDSDFVKVEHSQYLLRPIYNPDQTVMKHYMMTKKIYPVSAPMEGTKRQAIQLNYEKREVSFQVGRGDKSPRLIFKFEAFDDLEKRIYPSQLSERQKKIKMTKEDKDDLMQSIIDESFFEDFKSKDVKDQIFTMIRYADVMDELYKSFK